MNRKVQSIIIGILIIAVLVFLFSTQNKRPSVQQETIDFSELTTLPTSSEEEKITEEQEKKTLRTFNIDNMNIEIIKEGQGETIANGKTAVVHYTGKLTDGTVFDSSIPRGQAFEFLLGAGMVIEGWEKGIVGMKVGEQRILTIPPEMGYGARGAGAVIPPNATLIFEVELLGIK